MSNDIDINKPILHVLEKRARYLGQPDGYEWVLKDPIVSSFTPALYILNMKGFVHLAKKVQQDCYEIYWQNVAFWVKRERQLKQILEQFEEESIEVIPLKGAALLEQVYKKIGLRTMGDIDILVRDKDFLRSAEILLAYGMKPKWRYESGDLFEFTQLPCKFWPGELSFLNDEGLHVDLHQDLVTYHWFKTAYPMNISRVWDRSSHIISTESQDSCETHLFWRNRLSSNDMLAHLCIHLASHGLKSMKNFFDIDLFIRTSPEGWDWDSFVNSAKQWQILSCAYHVFIFCKVFFDTPIPQNVLEQLKPSRFDRFLVGLLITPKTILKYKNTLGLHFPTLVKFSLFDSSKIRLKTLRNLLLPDSSFFNNNSMKKTILEHWCHIIKVTLRGD